MKIEDKAYFDKEWTEAGFSASFYIKKLQGMMAVYQGENDNEYRNKIIGYAKTLANNPDFVLNGVSSKALAKKAFDLVKFKYARQGSKAKFYLNPSNISLILKQIENENRQITQSVKQKQALGKKSDLMDATSLAHGMAYSNATANTIQDLRKISKSKNPADKQAAQQALSKIEAIESFWQAKHTELQNQYRAAHSRQGYKAKFAKEYILWALPKGETDRLHERPIAEGLYTPAQVDDVKRKATAAGWHSFRVAALMGFDDMTNAFKGKGIKKGNSCQGTKAKFASDTNYAHKNTIKIKGKSDKIYALIYAEEGYGDNLTGFWNGHVQNNSNPKVNDVVTIGQFKSKEAAKAAAIKALKQEEQGTNFSKAKFANRGAFAEASSSPVLGSLLEKKVMPEGGWRAVETDGGALVIAFEDGDIAGNFARRASENGYSATAPMAMAGRFWNVKVQNENKQ